MDDAFSKFADAEVSKWAAYGNSVPSKDLLVKVSGSLQSPIAHHVHQPSFTTLHTRNGETADETNPCIASIMGNAFEKDKSLIYDHLLRRHEKSEGLKDYPEDVTRCHEAYIQKVRESMEAKVEVVYGTPVKERMLQEQAFKVDVLPLWGEYEGICIFLDCESNYSNAQQGHQHRRIIVFVAHPQRFLYPREGECARQDKLLAVAAKISRTGFIERYYEDRKWRMIVPVNFPTIVRKNLFGTPSKQSQNDGGRSSASENASMMSMTKVATADVSVGPVVRGCWDSYFDGKRPLSIKELRVILPKALATEMDPEKHTHKWESPGDFPEIVGTWFGGQREILFQGMSVYNAADIMTVYRRLCPTAKDPLEEKPSLAETIYGLIKEQARVIGNLPTSSLDDLIYYGFRPFDVIETVCFTCRQPMPPDTKARWSVIRLGHYVPRARRCNTELCGGKQRGAIPKDPYILFAWGWRASLVVEVARNIREDWRDSIRDPKDCEGKLSQPVESWCIQCTEYTKLTGGRTRYVDESPRWTLGDPPKYVERRPECLNCVSEGRAGTARFIPVDVTIPSIYKKRVSTFEENWGNLQEDVKAEVLGVELASSKKPRVSAGPEKGLSYLKSFEANVSSKQESSSTDAEEKQRAKAPAKLKSFEANVSSKQESSSPAAEEKQNGTAVRNAANASASGNRLATGSTHGKFVNGVVPASDQSPTLPPANTIHQPNIGVTSKRPSMLISDLLSLSETKSKIKRQRIA